MTKKESRIKLAFNGIRIRIKASVTVLFGRKYIALTFVENPDKNFYRIQLWDSGNINPVLYNGVKQYAEVWVTSKYFNRASDDIMTKVNEILECPKNEPQTK